MFKRKNSHQKLIAILVGTGTAAAMGLGVALYRLKTGKKEAGSISGKRHEQNSTRS